jgi:hypothetical protein
MKTNVSHIWTWAGCTKVTMNLKKVREHIHLYIYLYIYMNMDIMHMHVNVIMNIDIRMDMGMVTQHKNQCCGAARSRNFWLEPEYQSFSSGSGSAKVVNKIQNSY